MLIQKTKLRCWFIYLNAYLLSQFLKQASFFFLFVIDKKDFALLLNFTDGIFSVDKWLK